MFNFETIDELFINPVENYIKNIDHYCIELYKLGMEISILKKLYDFHLKIFGVRDDNFFYTTIDSLYSTIIITLFRITQDKNSEYNLSKFRNMIVMNLKEEFKVDFFTKLETNQFDKTLDEIFKAVKELRHQIYAHSNKLYLDGKIIIEMIPVEKLINYYNKISECLVCLLFGSEINNMAYYDEQTEDLDFIFDLIINSCKDIRKEQNQTVLDNYYKKKNKRDSVL